MMNFGTLFWIVQFKDALYLRRIFWLLKLANGRTAFLAVALHPMYLTLSQLLLKARDENIRFVEIFPNQKLTLDSA